MAAVPALLTMIGTRINELNDRLVQLLFRQSTIQNDMFQYLRLLVEHNIQPGRAEWVVLTNMERAHEEMMEHLNALAWDSWRLRGWYEQQLAMEAVREAELVNILWDLGGR